MGKPIMYFNTVPSGDTAAMSILGQVFSVPVIESVDGSYTRPLPRVALTASGPSTF